MDSLTFGDLEELIFWVETSHKPEVCPSCLTEAIDKLGKIEEKSNTSIKDLTKTLGMFVAYAAINAQYYAEACNRNLTYLIGKGAVEKYVHKLKLPHTELNRLRSDNSVSMTNFIKYAKEMMDVALSYTQQKIDSHHLNTTVEKLLVCGLSEISGQPVKDLLANAPRNSRPASYFTQSARC